jgi:hypothetical protein
MDRKYCGIETDLRPAIQGKRFTPHGIEDIMRRETRIVLGGDSLRDSEVDSYHGRDSEVESCCQRDSPCPLNLSKCYQTETDSKKVMRETESLQGEEYCRGRR